MNFIILVVLFFLSFEAVMWGWTLNRHSAWLEKHPEYDRRLLVSYPMLRKASKMAGFLSIVVWLWWITISIGNFNDSLFHYVVCSFIVASIQLSHIHFMAIVARYSCLPLSMWPVVSKQVSIILSNKFGVHSPPKNSMEVHACWFKKGYLRDC